MSTIIPDRDARRELMAAVSAQINLCYTCGSCVNECPVNNATGRLQPRRLVWMANLGMAAELAASPEIWYCVSCGRCARACPMTVNPARFIRHLRWEAVRRGTVSAAMPDQLRALHRDFQRVRYQAAASLLAKQPVEDAAARWDEWAARKPASSRTLALMTGEPDRFRADSGSYLDIPVNVSSCFTCGECSNACPAAFEREVFDPLLFWRLTNMGMKELALNSPSLWLCLQCESCTATCGQKVSGHLVIRRLRQMAEDEGIVDAAFLTRWKEVDDSLYAALLDRVDGLMK